MTAKTVLEDMEVQVAHPSKYGGEFVRNDQMQVILHALRVLAIVEEAGETNMRFRADEEERDGFQDTAIFMRSLADAAFKEAQP